MQETILIVYLVVAITLVGIILLQQGKGAEMGASFGAGGANTVFGAAGSGNAMTKTTTILAILFFGIALSISYLNSAPPVVVDDVFDEAPAVEKTSIESELPIDPTATTSDEESKTVPTNKSIESELPPSEKTEEVLPPTAQEETEEKPTKKDDSK